LSVVVWDVAYVGAARIATEANANALRIRKWCITLTLLSGERF